MTTPGHQTAADWKETVRDIFDLLVLKDEPISTTEDQILDWILLRHGDYFAGPTD